VVILKELQLSTQTLDAIHTSIAYISELISTQEFMINHNSIPYHEKRHTPHPLKIKVLLPLQAIRNSGGLSTLNNNNLKTLLYLLKRC
jgi:hypothetical protein